ncbi:MAG: zinc-binding dehydrogenase [Firmicutes bacterium]|nr:zinc-binding dehydrogenase [Bacillota bacterium]
MKAVLLNGVTQAADIKFTRCSVPKVKPGWVLVKVKAFGLNRSEQVLRLSEIEKDYIKKPIIPGIECAGEIADASDSGFETGQKVVALMGGMGRRFDGSYAEYALLPVSYVFPVYTGLTWKQLAAVPKTYFTAWGSLFECLDLKYSDTLLVRGADCDLGYAAVQLAKALGCRVIASVSDESKKPFLEEADEVLIDTGNLSDKLFGATKALDLAEVKTLYDTMHCVMRGGIVCSAEAVHGESALEKFDPVKDIPNGIYLTGFHDNSPNQDIINDVISFLDMHHSAPGMGAEYAFDDIAKACADMESGKVTGKIVVYI